jgi:hypothetical protein
MVFSVVMIMLYVVHMSQGLPGRCIHPDVQIFALPIFIVVVSMVVSIGRESCIYFCLVRKR